MNQQTFRYLACGGGNTLLEIVVYFVSYNFILHKEMLHTPFVSIRPHIAAFIIAFCVTFPIGYYLMKNFVFTGSSLKRRVQLFRYLVLVLACIGINYLCIPFFVEKMGMYPTIAKICTTVVVVSFSYVSQRYFTFKQPR